MLATVPGHDKQLTIALISGLKLTDLFLLGLWNKRGQNNSPQSTESLLDGSVQRLNEPQLVHIKEVKGWTVLTARDIKHEFKTIFGWSSNFSQVENVPKAFPFSWYLPAVGYMAWQLVAYGDQTAAVQRTQLLGCLLHAWLAAASASSPAGMRWDTLLLITK